MAFADRLRAVVQPLHGGDDDYDRLLEAARDARFVLLGEASHGTHEFYRERARITRRLIAEHGFAAVGVEADWPAAHRVSRYVRGAGDDGTAVEALADFRRFPAWMWRNADVLDFVGWLRAHNDGRAERDRVGFFGLDLYSLHESMDAVLAYLDKVDPDAARRARERYACFESFADDPQAYGHAASLSVTASCEDEVVGQLLELRRRAADLAQRDGRVARDEFFQAEQNARTVRNAEQYYRTMFRGHVESWNLRDRHMVETLEAVAADLERAGRPAKVVVWAHNSHLGDARATEMSERDELNVGQLVRERYGRDALLVGFTTYTGTVTAASDWGAPAERKQVRPALRGSYEALFHEVGVPRFVLRLLDDAGIADELARPRLQRAIGVIYRPGSERASHYFHARLAQQFDAVLHFDVTRAVEPLERSAGWERGELPETFPHAV
jgi:erythromycin esterase-like protein